MRSATNQRGNMQAGECASRHFRPFPSLNSTAAISFTLEKAKSVFFFQARPGVCN